LAWTLGEPGTDSTKLRAAIGDAPENEASLFLIAHQDVDGNWDEPWYTAVGFPRVFYLRYHGYRAFFPLWALARYRRLSLANSPQVTFGL
jgi:squalene-hopene/tetraprenyl-beta-curcumene cyclase